MLGRSAGSAELPEFSVVIEQARSAIANFDGYRPGDPIQRDQASQIITAIERSGWAVPGREALLARVPAKNDPFFTLLHGNGGRDFERKIAKLPGGLDRVDNLLKLPDGPRVVKQLIDGPGGDELIRYLTTAEGGKELGRMLQQDAKVDFSKPTGRIYTAKALMIEVEAAYLKAAKDVK
ncbi:MAG: hypothetical protein QM811_20545 [Pirellulales bacterium]